MAEITSKRQMYELLHAGKLGNTSPSFNHWTSAAAYAEARNTQMAIRTKRPGGPFIPNLSPARLECETNILKSMGYTSGQLQYSEMMDSNGVLCQGYLMRGETGWVLEYNDKGNAINMREAMKSARTVYGLTAISTVRTYLDADDYDDMMELFDDYPDAIVEFTSYRRCCGTSSDRRTVVWEVRNY